MDAAKTVNVTFGIDAAPNIFGAPLTATIPAGTPYTLTLTALDSDDVPAARVMTVTTSLPAGASFVDNHDGTATLSWTPTSAQAGDYAITFQVSDGTRSSTKTTTLTVTP